MAKPWERVGVIAGVFSLLVAIAALISSIIVPEIRCYFRLRSDVCSPTSTATTPINSQGLSNKLSSLKGYSIAIFFLKDHDDLQREATNIQDRLIKSGINLEKVVLKPVSALTLQYLETPKGNEIRFDVGSEEVPAESLQQLLEGIIPDKRFNLRDANNSAPTKEYISIFLVP